MTISGEGNLTDYDLKYKVQKAATLIVEEGGSQVYQMVSAKVRKVDQRFTYRYF